MSPKYACIKCEKGYFIIQLPLKSLLCLFNDTGFANAHDLFFQLNKDCLDVLAEADAFCRGYGDEQ